MVGGATHYFTVVASTATITQQLQSLAASPLGPGRRLCIARVLTAFNYSIYSTRTAGGWWLNVCKALHSCMSFKPPCNHHVPNINAADAARSLLHCSFLEQHAKAQG